MKKYHEQILYNLVVGEAGQAYRLFESMSCPLHSLLKKEQKENERMEEDTNERLQVGIQRSVVSVCYLPPYNVFAVHRYLAGEDEQDGPCQGPVEYIPEVKDKRSCSERP